MQISQFVTVCKGDPFVEPTFPAIGVPVTMSAQVRSTKRKRDLSMDSFSSCSANVTRSVKLYVCVCVCVDTQSQCVLHEIQTQIKETTSYVTFYVLRHKVLKVSIIL